MLAPFTYPIRAEFSNDGKSITLLQGFYYYRAGNENERINIGKGFISDGFTNLGCDFIVKRYGKGIKCAILHDYLCKQARMGKISRKHADQVFLEAMLETKAFSRLRAYAIYTFVRLYAIITRQK